ncbi:MAG: response regulator [Oscillospiraceae bacterium]|nr:response regulator [Oscillospiraceae bacterium]
MNSVIIHFNLPVLLKKSTLEIREDSEKNPKLNAEEYFTELQKNIKNGTYKNNPEILNAYSERGWLRESWVQNLRGELKNDSELSSLTLSRLLALLDKAESERKPRVLAVDDVSVVLNVITEALSKDYEVFSLSRAEHVEKFLQHTVPDFFLLDIEMPGMNGYDLVQVIRNFEEHKETPIMFLTGNATVKNFQAATALGVADFIAKPVNPDILLGKVSAQIKKKKSF